MKQLLRSKTNRTFLGVCGGVAHYFGIDPTLVRLVWAIGTLFSVGLGLLAYVVAGFVIPEEP